MLKNEILYQGVDVNRRTLKLKQVRAALEALQVNGLPEGFDLPAFHNHEMAHVIYTADGTTSHIEAGRRVDEEGKVVSWYLKHLRPPEEILKLTGVEVIRESLAPLLIKTEKPVSPLSRTDWILIGRGILHLPIDLILKVLD